jgi:hypothetical protein
LIKIKFDASREFGDTFNKIPTYGFDVFWMLLQVFRQESKKRIEERIVMWLVSPMKGDVPTRLINAKSNTVAIVQAERVSDSLGNGCLPLCCNSADLFKNSRHDTNPALLGNPPPEWVGLVMHFPYIVNAKLLGGFRFGYFFRH